MINNTKNQQSDGEFRGTWDDGGCAGPAGVGAVDSDAAADANATLAEMRRRTFAVDFDPATGALYAVTDDGDTALTSATFDRATGRIILTFDY